MFITSERSERDKFFNFILKHTIIQELNILMFKHIFCRYNDFLVFVTLMIMTLIRSLDILGKFHELLRVSGAGIFAFCVIIIILQDLNILLVNHI